MNHWVNKRCYLVSMVTILLLPGYSSGKTRTEVVTDAEAYAALPWTAQAQNLLDVRMYIDNGTPVPDIVENSTDGIDDRAQQYYNSKDGKTYYNVSGNRSWWPFFKNDNITGEAYAWAGYRENPFARWGAETTTAFSLRMASANKWIAGKAAGDILPSGYAGFAGLDCSGFVGNSLDINKYADDGYKFNVTQIKERTVSVKLENMQPGDIFASNGHILMFLSWETKYSRALVRHAVPYSYVTNIHERRVITEAVSVSSDSAGVVKLYNAHEKSYVPHEAKTPFPQFVWITPTKERSMFDPLTQAIELTIKSGNLVQVRRSSITLVIDGGLATATTIHVNAPGMTITPAVDSNEMLVHYAIPAASAPSVGTHTVTAYAVNTLDLESGDTLEFSVGSSTVPPMISWADCAIALALPRDGTFSGTNTLETAPWFHTSAVRLQFDSDLAPLKDFTIYTDDTMGSVAYAKTFIPGTKTAVIGDALTGFADKTGYYAVLADKLGNATTMYFHLDKSGPTIESTATSRINADGAGLHFDVAGQAYGGVSGIDGDVVLLPGDHGPDEEYAGPSYPPGPSTKTFSFNNITESKRLVSFDRAGWIGTYDLLVYPATDTLSVSTIGGATGGGGGSIYSNATGGPSGVMLRNAHLSVSGNFLPERAAGVELLGQPTGMKLELWAEAEDLPAEVMPNLPVNYGFSPASSQKLIEASGGGYYDSAITNLPMRHVTRLKLVATPNNNTVRYTYWCDPNGDGISDVRCESTLSSGTFVLEGTGEASVAYASIYALRHFYQWLPSGPNQSVQAGDVNVGILNVTTGGNITVETARRTLKQPGYKMAKSDIVYEIKTTAKYDGPIKLKIGGYCAFNNTPDQNTHPLILHCSAGGAACLPVETRYEDCTALATMDSLSPFAVMIPLDDITAPQTELSMIGDTAVVEGRIWITTDTYLDLTAGDRATIGDISGVATSYYLLDAAPTPECLATPYDPQAPYGSCANPVYAGAFTLNEGSRTVNYLSVDNWGNFEQPKTKNVFVDGTSPTTALAAKGVELRDGETAYITEADSITITAVDPVSGGVSSGLKDRLFVVNESFEDCPADPDFTGRAGTCRNPRYTEPFSLPVGTYTVSYNAVDYDKRVLRI